MFYKKQEEDNKVFSRSVIQATLNDVEVIKKYDEYIQVSSKNGFSDIKELAEWVEAISQGECADFSLKDSVISVIEAAIFNRTYTLEEMEQMANAGSYDRIMNSSLSPEIKDNIINLNNLKQALPVTIDKPIEISLEQQFSIQSFKSQVNLMSGEQCRVLLIELHKQTIIKENLYKDLLLKQWGSI